MKNEMSQPDFALERIEDQVNWYDKKNGYNKGTIDGKFIALVTGVLGAIIVLFEAVQQLNHYHHNWITYRSTAEALKHTKYLYLSRRRSLRGG